MTNEHFYHVLDQYSFQNVFSMYMESGLLINAFDSMKRNCINFIMKENRFYRTHKEYVDDVVSFDNLGIGNFYGIFKAYFVFCSIVLTVFVIHLIINFILSRRGRIEFIIYLNFQRFVNMKNRIGSCFKCTWFRMKNLVY